MKPKVSLPEKFIMSKILVIREQKVMLDMNVV